MKFNDVFPFYDFNPQSDDLSVCVSLSLNRYMYRVDLNNYEMVIFDMFFRPLITGIAYGFLFIFLFFILVFPSIINGIIWFSEKKVKTSWWRFIFSLNNQIILLLTVATLIPPFWLILDYLIFIPYLDIAWMDYALRFSFYFIAVAFLETIVKW